MPHRSIIVDTSLLETSLGTKDSKAFLGLTVIVSSVTSSDSVLQFLLIARDLFVCLATERNIIPRSITAACLFSEICTTSYYKDSDKDPSENCKLISAFHNYRIPFDIRSSLHKIGRETWFVEIYPVLLYYFSTSSADSADVLCII